MAQQNYPSLEDFAHGAVSRQIDEHGGVMQHIREQVRAELREKIESLDRVTEQDVTQSFEELREELSRMAGAQRAITILERLSEQWMHNAVAAEVKRISETNSTVQE